MADASGDRGFDAAYAAILSLQSKGADLVAASRTREEAVEQVRWFAGKGGIDLEALPDVVHIAGSKGKGSTAVMVDALLRARGLKTALFTSPHLCNVRERIRLNGMPIAEDKFLLYFWQLWDRLHVADDTASAKAGVEFASGDGEAIGASKVSLPPFFRFLTLLCLHICIQEPIDALVLEVGLGGRLDATNVVPNPIVTACMTLDLEHTAVLGNTLAKIAREKAGIFKKGVPAIVVPQEASAMAVLEETAKTVGAPLVVIRTEHLSQRHGGTDSPSLPMIGMGGTFQYQNAAVALALTDEFMSRTGRLKMDMHYKGPCSMPSGPSAEEWATQPLAKPDYLALRTVSWPGRAQLLPMAGRAERRVWRKASKDFGREIPESVSLFIDGAHTAISIEGCAKWFKYESERQTVLRDDDTPIRHLLVFNCGHEKSPLELMQPLRLISDRTNDRFAPKFDTVLFCPFDYSRPSRFAEPDVEEIVDAYLAVHTADSGDGERPSVAAGPALKGMSPRARERAMSEGDGLSWQRTLAKLWGRVGSDTVFGVADAARDSGDSTEVHSSCAAAMERVAKIAADDPACQYHVLVTGSLYLVGAILDAVAWDPDAE